MAQHIFGVDQRKVDQRFITLGNSYKFLEEESINKIKEKVQGNIGRKIQPAWATLGWLDDSEFEPEGKVEFSMNGNLNSKSKVTRKEIEYIYSFNKLLDGDNEFVKERYINFDEVNFGLDQREWKVDELPKLRLTLFMNKGEGAIVYYQHSDRDKYKDSDNEEESDVNADVEYILPQEAETGRDRLTYHIPIIPGAVQEVTDKPGYIKILKKDPETSFIIKILTFKRKIKSDEGLIREAIKSLNTDTIVQEGAHRLFGEKKYKLHKFDVASNTFDPITHFDIDFDKKTLLLIHGTFSTIEGSYGGTYLSKYSPVNVVLQDLINSGQYEQILGFDHPTITHGAVENVEKLYKMLGNNKFTKRVNLMGTSRGALVCKQLANDSNNIHFEIEKILTFSGANGVGYFTAGDLAVKFLSIWKKTGGPVGKVIAVFAQFSLTRFLKMPGCQVMTIGSNSLNAILNKDPKNDFTIYQCVGADWNRKLYRSRWKRLPAVLLDATLKIVLGLKHDWVVNTKNQLIAPSGYKKRDMRITAVHTRILEVGHVRGKNPHEDIMKKFL